MATVNLSNKYIAFCYILHPKWYRPAPFELGSIPPARADSSTEIKTTVIYKLWVSSFHLLNDIYSPIKMITANYKDRILRNNREIVIAVSGGHLLSDN